jgi:hypothetical protein
MFMQTDGTVKHWNGQLIMKPQLAYCILYVVVFAAMGQYSAILFYVLLLLVRLK